MEAIFCNVCGKKLSPFNTCGWHGKPYCSNCNGCEDCHKTKQGEIKK